MQGLKSVGLYITTVEIFNRIARLFSDLKVLSINIRKVITAVDYVYSV